jgi:hypothetical protein
MSGLTPCKTHISTGKWRISGPIAAKMRQRPQRPATKFDFNNPPAYGTLPLETPQNLGNWVNIWA